jgi:hypothetical protein
MRRPQWKSQCLCVFDKGVTPFPALFLKFLEAFTTRHALRPVEQMPAIRLSFAILLAL